VLEKVYQIYAFIFGRAFFRKFNLFLFTLSLRGLGILNWQSDRLSGEKGWTREYLKEKKSPTVFDVGANVGKYSAYVLEINKESTVYAFEPHPKTYEILVKEARRKEFKPFNLALGDEEGILDLYDYELQDGSSHASLFKEVITDIHESNYVSHLVNIVCLDALLKELDIARIDLLKIDTEGNELNVLRGAKFSLADGKIKAILFEFNEMNVASRATFKDFWDLLSENYSLYRVLPGGKLHHLRNYSPVFCEIYAYQNIVALLK